MRAPAVSTSFARANLRPCAPQRAVFCKAEPATISELDAIEKTGLHGAQVEHAFTLAHSIWNRTPDQIEAVAEYLRNAGAQDPAKILFHNPKLLEYDVSSNGSELEHGKRARAKVTFSKNDEGEELVLVSFYATTAAFNTAPLSPYKP